MIKTASEWDFSTEPYTMLFVLREKAKTGEIDRKLRLFACACVRDIWHMLVDSRSCEAVEIAERYANGLSDLGELISANASASAAALEIYSSGNLGNVTHDWLGVPESSHYKIVSSVLPDERAWDAARAAEECTLNNPFGNLNTKEIFKGRAWISAISCAMLAHQAIASEEELSERELSHTPMGPHRNPRQAELLRCVFENPFQPLVIPQSWITQTVSAISIEIYNKNDFSLMDRLKTALLEAGCTEQRVLSHSNASNLHARGCWLVNKLLQIS
jgi:hypothetical protein